MTSAFLGPKRHVEVWLPPGYDENPTTRYPVLYMHDGQNLFDPRIANTGVDWGVDEAVVRLVDRGVIPPVIVVGVWSTAERSREYSPWHDAPAYARFLIEELMPRVNREFRTLTGPANTAAMGSSMGGLLSFYLVTHHPEVFGACGCMSTHFPLSEDVAARVLNLPAKGTPDTTPYVIRDIRAGLKAPPGTRYWFDYGSMSLDSAYGPTHAAVRTWLLGQHLVEGKDFVIRRYEGATHNEAVLAGTTGGPADVSVRTAEDRDEPGRAGLGEGCHLVSDLRRALSQRRPVQRSDRARYRGGDRPASAAGLEADALVVGLVSPGALGPGERKGLLHHCAVPPLRRGPARRDRPAGLSPAARRDRPLPQPDQRRAVAPQVRCPELCPHRPQLRARSARRRGVS